MLQSTRTFGAYEESALWIANNHKKISNPAIFFGIAFWIHTGLRPGELLALKHEDLKDNLLTVRRMYCYHEDVKGEDGKRIEAKIKPWLKTYKTGRSFAVDHEAAEILKECRRLQERKRYRTTYAFSIGDMPATQSVDEGYQNMLPDCRGGIQKTIHLS